MNAKRAHNTTLFINIWTILNLFNLQCEGGAERLSFLLFLLIPQKDKRKKWFEKLHNAKTARYAISQLIMFIISLTVYLKVS